MKRLPRSKPMHNDRKELLKITRRHFFGGLGFGIGSVALAALTEQKLFAQQPAEALLPKPPHFAPKAKNVIFLFMAGGPSQLDLFDYKPKLNQYDGELCPEELIKGERFAFIKGVPKLLGSPHHFARYGGSGAELSYLRPNPATAVYDIAVVRPMHTPQCNNPAGQPYMNTGRPIHGPPSL